MTEFAEWESFCVIVGAAAGALIGLQFVVMTLIAERPPMRADLAGAAFLTPTIIHFSAALLLSALLQMPWRSSYPAAAGWGCTGLAGVVYILLIAQRMRTQTSYAPVSEDWLFHVMLPGAAYALLVLSALVAAGHLGTALFGVGAAILTLLFIGIHNAWDAVVYHVLATAKDRNPNK
jgi:hypothetical protein